MPNTERVKKLGTRAQGQSILGNSIRERNKAMEDSSGLTEVIMKVNLLMDSSRVTANTILQM